MKIVWKPQILTAIMALFILAGIAMYLDYPEVAAACPAGIVALGMRLLEKE